MEYKYDEIKPLVVSEEFDGQMMKVSFKSADGNAPVQAVAALTPDQKDLVKNAGKQAVKTGFIYGIINAVSRMVGGAAGGGVGGSVARSATSSMGHAAASKHTDSSNLTKVKDTPENRQKGVVEAFKTVANMYEYDDVAKTWKAKKIEAPTA